MANWASKPAARTAVLVFAAPRGVELRRRGLPDAMRRIIDLPLDAAEQCGADVHVFSTDITAIAVEVRRRLPVSRLHVQHGGGFGARLTNAVSRLVALGYERIIILGRDCPQLSAVDCRRAMRSLDEHRLVIGPNERGGCYLIGLHAQDAPLLERVQWCAGVDAEQLRRAANGSVALLRRLRDVHGMADVSAVLSASRRCRRIARSSASRPRCPRRLNPTRRSDRTIVAPARAPPRVET